MSRKEINYLNSLTELAFLLAHRDILNHAKKITNQRMTGMIGIYADYVKDLERYVQVPHGESIPELHAGRMAAYNVCRKAVISLNDFGKHGAAVDALFRAFRTTVTRAPISEINNTMAAAERIAGEISKEELDALAMTERVERFVQQNRFYNESCAALSHNRRIRDKVELTYARENCSSLYRCILHLAKNWALQGDAECQEFVAWIDKG